MAKSHRAKIRKHSHSLPITIPLNFLLGCSERSLGNYELARLGESADLRRELHTILDRMIDQAALAHLAAWFRQTDRAAINQALALEESPVEWAKRQISERGQSEEELIPLPSLPPGAAHLAAAVRYAERNIAEGKCGVCPQPLAENSVRYCEKHLAAARHKMARKKGVQGEPGSIGYLYGEVKENTHGRQPGTLASLEMAREQRTGALFAELGIEPERAAVARHAVEEALMVAMPSSEASAMSLDELLANTRIPARQTGQNAVKKLLSSGRVQRIGEGISGNPYRYFACDPANLDIGPR